MQYTICHWATNRSDPQNLLSITLDVPLQSDTSVSTITGRLGFQCIKISVVKNATLRELNITLQQSIQAHGLFFLVRYIRDRVSSE